jgi:glycogen synthase
MTTAKSPRSTAAGELTFSIVVNTMDRAGPLRTLLQSLEHQSYPSFEVVVVVGPTQDNTLDMLADYEGRIRVLRCPTANLGRSRNIGLLAAQGDIVAFIDDDAVPCRRWLEQLARLFQDPGLDATGGAVYLIHPDYAELQHRIGIFSSLAEQVNVRTSRLEQIVPLGAGRQWVERMMGTNMAYRRQVLLDIGGFDEFFEWIYDDSELALRLAQAGKSLHPVKEAVVYHVPGSSRNRMAFTHNLKWWLQTRSAIYISIKNGPLAGDSSGAIARRCWQLFHHHWRWSWQLWREGKLTFAQFLRMRAEEIKNTVGGVSHGLRHPRRLIDPAGVTPLPAAAVPILPFQNSCSAQQPTVDPVSGRRPSILLPDPPLRICLLSTTYPPAQYEGVGRHTNLIARGLFELGHTVHVIARAEEERISFYDGAYVHRIPYHLDRYQHTQALTKVYHSLNHLHAIHDKVKRLILNDGIQVVDTPLWQTNGLVTAVSGIIPVVVRLQTAVRQIAALQADCDVDTRLIGDLEQALVEQADHLIPNSRATLAAMRRVYGITPSSDRATIVPHGIVPVPDGAVRPFDLDRRAREPGPYTVLYVGRLEKRKGTLDLFEAIPQVLRQVQNVRFIVVGGDNSQNDGFMDRTGMTYPAYFAQRYQGSVPHVQFTGAVSEETLQSLYQSCDLFVAPSLYESFGLIYLEAMNYGKPVIGCRSGGIPEVIDQGVTGLMTEPEAPVALAEAIVALLKSPVKLYEMGVAGRQQLLARFTHLQMARGFEQIYRSVIRAFEEK